MNRLIRFFFLLAAFVTTPAFSDNQYDYRKTTYKLVDISAFAGDRHGEFEGDIVAILSDGSHWKIHPKDHEEFAAWYLKEVISPKVRESSYFRKREHHFALYNHMRKRTVRAMLVKYPEPSKTVVKFERSAFKSQDELKLTLSDGSLWTTHAIKKFMHFFPSFSPVYLIRNNNGKYYLVSGSEREVAYIVVF